MAAIPSLPIEHRMLTGSPFETTCRTKTSFGIINNCMLPIVSPTWTFWSFLSRPGIDERKLFAASWTLPIFQPTILIFEARMFSPHFSNHHRFPATDARVPKNANSATVKQLDSVVEENTLKLFQWTSPYRQKARLVFGARQILRENLRLHLMT